MTDIEKPTNLVRASSEQKEIEVLLSDSSPELKNRYLEYRTKKDAQKSHNRDRTWESCCLKIDKEAAVYFVHSGLLGILIIFSACMLAVSDSCEQSSIWSSFLTMCIGAFLPSPRM